MGEVATILGGVSAKKSAEFAKEQADTNAQLSEIAAAETGAEHRRQLDTALGAIDVALGASNRAADSPTALAAIAATRKDFRRARIIETSNLLNQASQFRREGQIRLFEGKAARNIAFASAAGSFSEKLIAAGAAGGGGAGAGGGGTPGFNPGFGQANQGFSTSAPGFNLGKKIARSKRGSG